MKWLIVLLKKSVRQILSVFQWDPWFGKSWSQEGEDRILERIFEGKTSGFYIDVGAHHPMRFSNTYLFYKKGWCGINIDAMPGSMRSFQKFRSRDINIEAGVGLSECELDYYIFNEPALNGFSSELSSARNVEDSSYKIIRTEKVKVLTLCQILEANCSEGQLIDFMSVDVEGLDLDVLSSNDWERFRPVYVLAELLESDFTEIDRDKVVLLMRSKGYKVFAKCVNTVFFKDAQGKRHE
ncbi:methyltransferase, FkbM family [Pseudomonas straminea]|uniref:Methyltransferase, FkbM family n=1 Tax=Pseudomonas straminea TaxID=47882 RepID=A0A1I1SR32_PSEOC|nr:methyltransferase, FkbM family [Pseudomonas straminea]